MRKRLTYEFVKYGFEKEGYKLLSKEYVDSKTKLNYECPKGHSHSISWNNWQQGKRCFYCYGNGNTKKDIEFVRSEFKKEGYELLSKNYINNYTKLKYRCPFGHIHFTAWDKWVSGRRCLYCSKNVMPTFDFIKNMFKRESYILVSDGCKHSQSKLEYICPNGHRHFISWNSWQQGQRCPHCVRKISNGEVSVRNFVESLGIEVLPNDRSQVFNPITKCGLELDIWMPNINKAVEYNGEYWHKRSGRTNNDSLKKYLCKQNNIDLLVVWDYEWLSNNSICRNKIKKFVMGL
jgi:hypothetical protein